MGRHTKLTEAIVAELELAVNGAASYKLAAEHAGISERTFHAWRTRGRTEQDRLEQAEEHLDRQPAKPRTKKAKAEKAAAIKAARPLPDEEPFLQFLQRIAKANAAAVVRAEAQIAAAAGDDWRAAAWLVERRDPLYASPKARVQLEGSETGAPLVSIVAVDAGDPETRRLAHALLARRAGRTDRE
jgi:hypothetical protein